MIDPSTNTVSLLTPPGVGAIAVVRIAGPRTSDFLEAHFAKKLTPGRCVHGNLHDQSKIIDDCIAVEIDGRGVDLCLHGGAWVVKAVIDLAQSAGFTIAINIDATDPIESAMLESLPQAKTELALRTLLAQPEAWKSNPFPPPLILRGRAGAGAPQAPKNILAEEILNDHSLYHLLHPPQVAIVGIPNVGKSTLANQLFAQERSITANLPGTTRDWVGEIANLDGLAIKLLDTPGIRTTTDPIEHQAITRSNQVIVTSDLVILVLDATRPLQPEQQQLLNRWPQSLRVINQIDRPAAWDLSQIQAIQTIATKGIGIDSLRTRIKAHFGITDPYDITKPRWWTPNQRQALIAGSHLTP